VARGRPQAHLWKTMETIPQIGPPLNQSCEEEKMTSLVKYSIAVAGVKTSISLEEPFWVALKDIAARREMPRSGLVGEINSRRRQGKLSSEIRMFVLEFYRSDSENMKKPRNPISTRTPRHTKQRRPAS